MNGQCEQAAVCQYTDNTVVVHNVAMIMKMYSSAKLGLYIELLSGYAYIFETINLQKRSIKKKKILLD